MIEMENRFVIITGVRDRWVEGFGCGYKRKIQEILLGVRLFCMLTIQMPVLFCGYYTTVLQGVNVGRSWLKGTWDLPILLLTTVHESQLSHNKKFN